jgi:hypothetical protein
MPTHATDAPDRMGRIKKLTLLSLATAINASLLLFVGPLSRYLGLRDGRLFVYLVAVVAVWYSVYVVTAFLGTSASLRLGRRARTALGESAIVTLIFCAVLLGYALLAVRHLQ